MFGMFRGRLRWFSPENLGDTFSLLLRKFTTKDETTEIMVEVYDNLHELADAIDDIGAGGFTYNPTSTYLEVGTAPAEEVENSGESS